MFEEIVHAEVDTQRGWNVFHLGSKEAIAKFHALLERIATGKDLKRW